MPNPRGFKTQVMAVCGSIQLLREVLAKCVTNLEPIYKLLSEAKFVWGKDCDM